MKNLRSISALLRTESFELPFFLFLTLVLGGISVWTLIDAPALRSPERWIPFVVLAVVHIGMYWLAIVLARGLPRTLVYLAVQGLLAFGLNLLGDNAALIFSLYMGLIGISAGLLRLTRWGLVAIAYFLGLSLVSYGLNSGWQAIQWWVVAVIPMSTFVIIYVILYNRQVEARAQAQALAAELEQANRKLAEYADEVEELTLANERQRMARELHDTLSQGLAGLILQLEAVDAHLGRGRTERAQAIVKQSMQQARATLDDARRAIGGLRQEILDGAGLEESLRQEAQRFSEATGIPCRLELDLPAELPPAVGDVIQKTLAEGLSNVARHAHASQAWVQLAAGEGCLEMTLGDNGQGFDLQAVQPGHYGLLGMQERARLVGGTLEVRSEVGMGATIVFRMPLETPGN